MTTKFHRRLITAWHLEALTNSVAETVNLTLGDSLSNLQMNHLQIGRDYTLQKSLDLKNWSEVQTFTAGAGTNSWSTDSGDASATYFRLSWSH